MRSGTYANKSYEDDGQSLIDFCHGQCPTTYQNHFPSLSVMDSFLLSATIPRPQCLENLENVRQETIDPHVFPKNTWCHSVPIGEKSGHFFELVG